MLSRYPTEKPAVVLDIGTSYTKAGFAGDFAPLCILPTVVDCDGKQVWLRDCRDEKTLRQHLRTLLRNIYLKKLLCSMNDRPVIVCESLLSPLIWKKALAEVLLEDFGVLSLVFAPRHLLSLYSLGVQTGLVIHSGYSETVILPVYENMVLLNACQSTCVGSKALETNLSRLLMETATVDVGGKTTPYSDYDKKLSSKELEDIRVRTCFITPHSRAIRLRELSLSDSAEPQVDLPEPPKDVAYPLTGGATLTVPGRVREMTGEALYDYDEVSSTLAHLVLESILQSPIDARKALAANLVVIGGNSMMPGFNHRLQQELRQLAREERYSGKMAVSKFCFHELPVKQNYAAWLGGSILGSSGNLETYSLTRQTYLDSNKLIPDWSNFQPDSANPDVSR